MERLKYIANVSMGKDSIAMLWLLMQNKWPLDEVVFYDTGMEFDETYLIRDKVKLLCESLNIKYTELHPQMPFIDKMINYPHLSRNGKLKRGYGWCGGMCRWGTSEKIRTLDKYCGKNIQYIGIAYDEPERFKRLPLNKLAPLYEMKITEQQCMNICLSIGLLNPLYTYLKRVSCWCCRNKNLKELKMYKRALPKYWKRLVMLENVIGEPMKKPKWLYERIK